MTDLERLAGESWPLAVAAVVVLWLIHRLKLALRRGMRRLLRGGRRRPLWRHQRPLDRAVTTLYRFYDVRGRLLYVGIAVDVGRRMGQHADAKPWWLHVAGAGFVHYPDRATAEAAEREAIRTERPLYNIAHARTRRSFLACSPARSSALEPMEPLSAGQAPSPYRPTGSLT